MHRCFVDFELNSFAHITILGDEAKHMARVMRLKAGDTVEVCDGSGYTYPGEITEVTKNEVMVQLGEAAADASEPKTKVTLFAGLSKGAKMELVIQKSVELGVHAVVPVETEFAVAKEGKAERWQRIAFEAAKQCKRPTVPKIYEPVSFEQAAQMLKTQDVGLCAYEKAKDKTVKDSMQNAKIGGSVGIFVGPEGGFSEREIELLQQQGVEICTMGTRILRTETAAIVLLAVVMHNLGEI